MIGAIGDLVDDVVVRLGAPINTASDTPAVIARRRGGSAANVCAAVARLGSRARFIGQVGSDRIGGVLVGELAADGVDVVVRHDGRTGTIIVVVDTEGERTMLTDRGACGELADPQRAWLEDLAVLHVPLYSLVPEPLASTTRALVEWSHDAGVRISVDLSSAAVISAWGVDRTVATVAELRPHVVFANTDEAIALGDLSPQRLGAVLAVVEHGGRSALVMQHRQSPVAVQAAPLGCVGDTTGAGDAFAAGFLVAMCAGSELLAATVAGHASAAHHLRRLGAPSQTRAGA